jgi:hypothetical protein
MLSIVIPGRAQRKLRANPESHSAVEIPGSRQVARPGMTVNAGARSAPK